VVLQTFFEKQGWRRYFVVHALPAQPPTSRSSSVGVMGAPLLPPTAALLRPLQLQQLKDVKDLRAAAFAQIAPHAHAAPIPFWLTTVGFTEHLQQCDHTVLWALHTPAPSTQAIPFITQPDEARLHVFGKTLSALMYWLCQWAKPLGASRRCGHRDLRLLKSFHREQHNPQPFIVPFTANQYIQEWVRCCLYVARLTLLGLATAGKSVTPNTG
jgi:hypothetical protein